MDSILISVAIEAHASLGWVHVEHEVMIMYSMAKAWGLVAACNVVSISLPTVYPSRKHPTLKPETATESTHCIEITLGK